MGTEALIVNLFLHGRACSWTQTCLVPNIQLGEKSSKLLGYLHLELPMASAELKRSESDHGDARGHTTFAPGIGHGKL